MRKRHIPTQLTSMMNQTHWRCQWLNVPSMKSFFFERMRLLGTWRSVPRDRASFEQVEFFLSSFSSPRSPTLFSVSLPLDPQLQFFYFSQTGWTVAAIFGTVHLPSTRYNSDSFTLLLVTRQLRAPGAYPLSQNSNNSILESVVTSPCP